MTKIAALLLIAAAALLGGCNKGAGDNSTGSATGANMPASASK